MSRTSLRARVTRLEQQAQPDPARCGVHGALLGAGGTCPARGVRVEVLERIRCANGLSGRDDQPCRPETPEDRERQQRTLERIRKVKREQRDLEAWEVQ